MRRDLAIAWLVSVCSLSLRKSQAKTLSILVAAAMRVQRVSMANIGRSMGGMVKHQIKRCWRFCANERIETADAMRPIVARLLKKRKKKLLVAVDWVDIKGFQTLVASIVLKGRSIPLAWASTTNHVYDGHRSRNAFEEWLLLVLRDMIPPTIKVIILADRGFVRTALASFCQKQGFGYVIRIQPKVTVRLKGFHGKLLDYPVKKGIAKVLRRDSYRSDGAFTQSVVVHWPRNLPKKRDECWFLMTDQPGTARQLCKRNGQRMTIEQLFRDDKSKRNGWSLRDTQITKPDRIDRMLLILASKIAASIRLVGALQTNYVESGNGYTDLAHLATPADPQMSDLKAAATAAGADLTVSIDTDRKRSRLGIAKVVGHAVRDRIGLIFMTRWVVV